jgi:nucleotide-binding universal stress UspA family protein
MYSTILVPLDGSELAEKALPIASTLAQATGARLTLVRAAWAHVVTGFDPTEAQVKAVREAEAYLKSAAKRLAAQGVFAETRTPYESAAEGILMEVDIQHADLVVMCTHGRSGLGRLIYGSVAKGVLGRSPVPILLVRPTDAAKPSNGDLTGPAQLLVPLDGSDFAEAILPDAIDLAQAMRGELVLLRIVDPSDPDPSSGRTSPECAAGQAERPDSYLARTADQLRRAGLSVRTVVRFASPADAILAEEASGNFRLVAMATHGRTGLRDLITGSVAREVILKGTLPDLLVRPAGLRHDAPGRTSGTEGQQIECSRAAAQRVERAG